MKFYNRTKEIEELRRIQGRAFESRSRMTVITGHRRIGKTSLALRATEGESHSIFITNYTEWQHGIVSTDLLTFKE